MASNCKDYDFGAIEPHWQAFWEREKTFRAKDFEEKSPYYILDMFPYPSGAGLHAGHTENYAASDILDRYQRAKGRNVLHPMGWDAFGLPAEQYAIKTGTHPAETTRQNIDAFRAQIKRLGVAIDWDREVNTTDPHYFKWTQWIFLQLFKAGLAYVDERPVNWCPQLGTVLANEEVIDGKSEVGGFPVERRALRQWVLKITAYAEKLLQGLEEVDWPDSTKAQQKNWIGRSEGAEVYFPIKGYDEQLTVFTTRPDTIFGATFMVVAPEHPLVQEITTGENRAEVDAYIEKARSKSDLDRTDLAKEKSGVFTGAYCLNPVTGKEIPIWIADYVLMTYGTGAIMAVPAQDERDWEFAEQFGLPIVRTVQPPEGWPNKAYTGEGPAINSDFLDGLGIADAKKRMTEWLDEQQKGGAHVNFKLRDWLFSRQRYWGEPFPIIWVDERAYQSAKQAGGTVAEFMPAEPVVYEADGQKYYALPVPESELPVTLPQVENYKPAGDAQSPLANARDWVQVWLNVETGETRSISDEAPGSPWVRGDRETNTMPQWAGSCWYYLRYLDPKNAERFVDLEKEEYWGTPDLYIGGAEHAVLHLLYARFWHRFLYDQGFVTTKEPFTKLFHQGIILGEMEYQLFVDDKGKPISAEHIANADAFEGEKRRLSEDEVEKVRKGKRDVFVWKENPEIELDARAFKMSKSRGNVVNPDDYIKDYGADSLRLYEMFMGPLADAKPWSSNGIEGPHRFLKRLWRLIIDDESGDLSAKLTDGEESPETEKVLQETIKKVSEDIENLSYNTAISQLMILLNQLQKADTVAISTVKALVQMVAPFAPHLGEELWERLGETPSVVNAGWPQYDPSKLETDTAKIGLLVNGKPRGEATVSKNAPQDEVMEIAKGIESFNRHVEGKTVRKVIYVPGKILNVVAN